eukprot:CAMPEP_0175165442 /NCGR_PEP_ID=MMETSP0087-20121206/27088_1 /TAXON_ID=136419 /ORGANISM="Unknown Unknown, Strain D1" /LENGTH=2435 /DNA_ID=CAMNT_0016454819 /DNA_START=1 /DNA_END=7308 /DNA_ORIENTATION=-
MRVNHLERPFSRAASSSTELSAREANFASYIESQPVYGIPDAKRGLRLLRTFADPHVENWNIDEYQQVHAPTGLSIEGAHLKVTSDQVGSVVSVHGLTLPDVELPAIRHQQPRELGHAARRYLMQKLGNNDVTVVTVSEPRVLRPGLAAGVFNGPNHVVRKVVLKAQGSAHTIFVDASSGAVVSAQTFLHKALTREVVLEDKRIVWSETNKTVPADVSNITAAEIQTITRTAKNVYDLFKNMFGHVSFDKKDSPLIAKRIAIKGRCDSTDLPEWGGGAPAENWVHFTTCTDQQLNRNASINTPDIIAHEWAHAYTNYIDGLEYQSQAGAIHEAFSDILGAALELLYPPDAKTKAALDKRRTGTGQCGEPRWVIGDDNWLLRDSYRDLFNPSCPIGQTPKRPSKVSEIICTPYDNGGTHDNSLIASHMFPMVVDGAGDVSGIGLTKALHIWYRAKVQCHTPTTTFAYHGECLENACNLLASTNVLLADQNGNKAVRVSPTDCLSISKAIEVVELKKGGICANSPLKIAGFYPHTFPLEGGSVALHVSGPRSDTVQCRIGDQYVETIRPDGETPGLIIRCPVPPRHFLMGNSNTFSLYLSFDGGKTWTEDKTVTGAPIKISFHENVWIQNLYPKQATVLGNTTVTITGKNFQFFKGCTKKSFEADQALDDCFGVKIGGVRVSATLKSNTTIEAVTPPGKLGKVQVEVSVDGSIFYNSLHQFEYIHSASLKGLAVSGGCELTPTFEWDVYDYSCSVPGNIENVVLTYNSTEPAATVVKAGENSLFETGKHLVSALVTGSDGQFHKSYQVVVNRLKSTDTRLKSIHVPQCPNLKSQVEAAFAAGSGTTSFTCQVPFNNTYVDVFPTPYYPGATASLYLNASNGTNTNGIIDDPAHGLLPGNTPISVHIDSEDKNNSQTYIFQITRLPNVDARIEKLSTIDCDLIPAFSPDIYNYDCVIPVRAGTDLSVKQPFTLGFAAKAFYGRNKDLSDLEARLRGTNAVITPEFSDTCSTCCKTCDGYMFPVNCNATNPNNPCAIGVNVTNKLKVTLSGVDDSSYNKEYTFNTYFKQIQYPNPVPPNPLNIKLKATTLWDGSPAARLPLQLVVTNYTGSVNITGFKGFHPNATSYFAESSFDYKGFELSVEVMTGIFMSQPQLSGDLSSTSTALSPYPFKMDNPGQGVVTIPYFIPSHFTTQQEIPITLRRNTVSTNGKLASLLPLRTTSRACVLNPAFSPDVFSYSCTVPHEISVLEFSARTQNPSATIWRSDSFISTPVSLVGSLRGSYYVAELANLTVAATTSITFYGVVEYNGVKYWSNSSNYTIAVSREQPNVARLKNLSIVGCQSFRPPFQEYLNDAEYECSVPFETNSISIASLQTSHVGANATVSITPDPKQTPNITVGSRNTVKVLVISPSGFSNITYTVVVVRQEDSRSSLSAISINNSKAFSELPTCTLDPAFSPSVLRYDCILDQRIQAIDVAATAAQTSASVAVSDSKSLRLGGNQVEVVVTAKDHISHSSYLINAVRASDNARLVALSIANCPFTFDPTKTVYSCSVPAIPAGGTNLTVSYTRDEGINAAQVVTVFGASAKPGVKNYVQIRVVAEDKRSTVVYVVVITEGTPTASPTPSVGRRLLAAGDIDVTVSNCVFQLGTFVEALELNTCKIRSVFDSAKITITSTTGKSFTVKDKAGNVISQSATVPLEINAVPLLLGGNEFSIEVNNESKKYTLLVNREKPDDNTLSFLSLSPCNLAFVNTTNNYTCYVESNVSRVQLSYNVSDQYADTGSSGANRSLAFFINNRKNYVNIWVIAQNGERRDYEITVIRKLERITSIKNVSISGCENGFTPAYSWAAANTTPPAVFECYNSLQVIGVDFDAGLEQKRTVTPAVVDQLTRNTGKLAYGTNDLILNVTAQDPTSFKSVRFLLFGVVPTAVTNVSLINRLKIAGCAFNASVRSDVLDYHCNQRISNNVLNFSLDVEPTDKSAKVCVLDQCQTPSSSNSISVTSGYLAVGNAFVNVTVTSKDTTSVTKYRVHYDRMAGNEARIASLKIQGCETITFTPDTLNYTCQLDYKVTSVNITQVETMDPQALFLVNRVNKPSMPYQFPPVSNLNVGDNNLEIQAIASDLQTRKSYNVKLQRNFPETDNTLKILSVEGCAFEFDNAASSFSCVVNASLTLANVTATPNNTRAVVTISTDPPGQDSLSAGINIFQVKVVSEKGDSKFYEIIVTRALVDLPASTKFAVWKDVRMITASVKVEDKLANDTDTFYDLLFSEANLLPAANKQVAVGGYRRVGATSTFEVRFLIDATADSSTKKDIESEFKENFDKLSSSKGVWFNTKVLKNLIQTKAPSIGDSLTSWAHVECAYGLKYVLRECVDPNPAAADGDTDSGLTDEQFAIIGGCAGAVILLVAAGAVIYCKKKRKNGQGPKHKHVQMQEYLSGSSDI